MKTGRMPAVVVGMLLCGSAHTAPAAGAESIEPVQPAILATLHYASSSDPGPSIDRVSPGNPEVLPRNSNALVRTKVRMALGRNWLGFLYVDLGAGDSALRWQGLVGIQGGHGFDLLGGWRRVTYRFSPGMGFDSLDFNGPFVGATFAW